MVLSSKMLLSSSAAMRMPTLRPMAPPTARPVICAAGSGNGNGSIRHSSNGSSNGSKTAPGNGKPPAGLVKTVWQLEQQVQQHPKLEQDIEVDVCIIGAGISGLSIAYNLVTQGKMVAVLEARTVGSGQTGRTTAHIMTWNDDYYHMIEEQFSKEKSALVASSHRAAADKIEEVVRKEDIDCKLRRLDGFLFAVSEDEENLSKLDQELAAAHRAGLTDTEKVDLGGDPKAGGARTALRFPGAGDFQPLAYLRGLAAAVEKHGGKIYEGTRVKKTEGGLTEMYDGRKVRAQHVVHATNSPLHHNLAVHSRQTAWRSYVIGLQIPKEEYRMGQYWSTEEPYHYVRLEEVEGQGPILVVGGEDHLTGIKPDDYKDCYQSLEAWTRKRWPAAGEVVYKWSGQVMEPADLLGLYGRDPANDFNLDANYWVATGDSGQGMTGGTIAGMVIADQILGRQNQWADLYSPSRLPPPTSDTAQELGQELGRVAKNFGELLTPLGGTQVRDVDQIKAGEGAVLQRGTAKLAAYRDDDGDLRVFSAVCPHLKCLVQYNPNERTFDCPCHGSHFDNQGRCINGPAKQGLEVMELATLGARQTGNTPDV